jgi:conjugative transfer signal peptidase TraF
MVTIPTCRRSSLVLGVLVLAAVVSTRWVRLNVSPSVPYGLYRLAALPTPLPRGTLVVLPVPPPLRPWQTMPLLKPVAAVAGDTACLSDAGLWVEAVGYGPAYRVAQGHSLPVWRGCLVVPPGEVFLASPAPRSLDSRYFGTIPVAALTARAVPLFTWR